MLVDERRSCRPPPWRTGCAACPPAPLPRPRARAPVTARPAAVLFDRDGTLVHDVPYNGDPDRVAPMPGARAALDRLRARGRPTGVVSNQSGVARGLLTDADVARRQRARRGAARPVRPVGCCPHGPDDGCACRKPAPGLVRARRRALGVDAARAAR